MKLLLAWGAVALVAAVLLHFWFAPDPPNSQPASARGPAEASLQEAIRWYTGVAGRVDDERARELLLEASATGDPVAQLWLARCYSRGRMGFVEDPARARALAESVIDTVAARAEAGELEAMFLMGTAYDEALGRPEDATVAVEWYRRAAEIGHVLAQHNLGNVYVEGRGVPQSDSLAVVWWRRAAAQGDAIPQYRLGTMYAEGRGVMQDLDSARVWYRRASERGLARADDALAQLP